MPDGLSGAVTQIEIDQRIYDLYDEYCHGGMDRRTFLSRAAVTVVGGLAMAQALMPRYARAQTISFTDARMKGTYVTYPSPGGNSGMMRGYLARPAGQGPFPVVLVIHENRGLLDQVKDIARRYAKEGFVALAIDLVSRAGGTNLQDAALNLILLDRLEECLEVPFTEPFVTLPLDKLEEDWANFRLAEPLQQDLGRAAVDNAFAVDQHAARLRVVEARELGVSHRLQFAVHQFIEGGDDGAAALFEPLAGFRHVKATDRRTAADFAEVVRDLLDVHYPRAEKVVLVMDNLNTHSPASFYEAFAPSETRRLTERLATPRMRGNSRTGAERLYGVLV